MYGAILGDLAGSRVEFNRNTDPSIDFWTAEDFYTDDTVLTIAVAEALLEGHDFGETLRRYTLNHPGRGYGTHFLEWARTGKLKLRSCGNGAAMRISPVAYAASSEAEVRRLSRAATLPSHPHPDGIKAARIVAMLIFKARRGATKAALFEEVARHWIDLPTIEAWRSDPRWEALALPTVEQALSCVYEAESFEEAVRNAVSIGGDADTIAAIAGSIAEPLYGIPDKLKEFARSKIGSGLTTVLDRFVGRWPLGVVPPTDRPKSRRNGSNPQ